MFLFADDIGKIVDAVETGLASGDLPRKVFFAVLGTCITAAYTWGKGRLDSRERRRERLRLVAETAAALRLCRELELITVKDGPHPLTSDVEGLVRAFTLREIEHVAEDLRKEGRQHPQKSRGLVNRIFLLYQPLHARYWVWHILFFVSLLSAFIWSSVVYATYEPSPVDGGFREAVTIFLFLVFFVPAVIFNLIGNLRDMQQTHPQPTLRRTLPARIFLWYRAGRSWLWIFRVLCGLILLISCFGGPTGFLFGGLPIVAILFLLANLLDLVALYGHTSVAGPEPARTAPSTAD